MERKDILTEIGQRYKRNILFICVVGLVLLYVPNICKEDLNFFGLKFGPHIWWMGAVLLAYNWVHYYYERKASLAGWEGHLESQSLSFDLLRYNKARAGREFQAKEKPGEEFYFVLVPASQHEERLEIIVWDQKNNKYGPDINSGISFSDVEAAKQDLKNHDWFDVALPFMLTALVVVGLIRQVVAIYFNA